MNKNTFAPTPPMGWNSYDYYDTTVNEEQVKANARVLAEKLNPYGWEYVVVDIEWYAHKTGSMREQFQYIPFASVEMDEFSRLLPDPERFPSSANGMGFKPLADYVHGLGLKFGIHIMRGIPRIAAHHHTKILGTDVTADMVADPSSICRWNPDMYGVRDTPAGQAYYDSIIQMYADWGVDFIKCDDICNVDNWVEHSPRGVPHAVHIRVPAADGAGVGHHVCGDVSAQYLGMVMGGNAWDAPHNVDAKFQPQAVDVVRQRLETLTVHGGRESLQVGLEPGELVHLHRREGDVLELLPHRPGLVGVPLNVNHHILPAVGPELFG